jgi:hypothetical protein
MPPPPPPAAATTTSSSASATAAGPADILLQQHCLFLRCGVEIRSYLLNRSAELTASQLKDRYVKIQAPLKPYDPYADLVESDLAETPGVLNAIDKGAARCGSLPAAAVKLSYLSSCVFTLLYFAYFLVFLL